MQALDDDDDYVASLLKRDAERHQNRIRSAGLTASKRRPDAPKPNLRFLKNVLRDVDSHNTALKLKEEEESRVKAKELAKEQRRNAKRGREEEEGHERSKRQRQDPVKERKGRWRDILHSVGEPIRDAETKHREHKRHASDREEDVKSSRHSRRSARRRSRSRSPSSDQDNKRDKRHRREDRRSRSPESRSTYRRRDEKPASSAPTALKKNRDRRIAGETDDSDPLEDIIGPRAPPKVKHKGRGTTSTSTTMDAHFRSDYDPKADISLTHEENDEWEMALEALKDRAKWKAQGADRLKAAGFTDDQVKRWEKGGEKSIEDVVWRKKGEDREWDRGKTIDDEGEIDTTPEWGRLKGT